MALKGPAALAMWWDIAPDMLAEFEHWHTHEHFPERLAIPGFERASRWTAADGGEGFFVMYETAGFDVFTSPGYLASLNAPSAWSTKMMPHHRNMVRCPCHVLESFGGSVARHAVTIRLAVDADRGALRDRLRDAAGRPGVVGAHLLATDVGGVAKTTEQRIRGDADRVAGWIVMVCGYELDVLRGLDACDLPGVRAEHVLSASMAAGDTA